MPPKKQSRVTSAGSGVPTVEDILEDKIVQLANAHWAPNKGRDGPTPLDPAMVWDIFDTQLKAPLSFAKLQLLEFSGYLEQYLWPHWSSSSATAFAHVMSVVILINEKFREDIPVWDMLTQDPSKFILLVRTLIHIQLRSTPAHTQMHARMDIGSSHAYTKPQYYLLFINLFKSYEQELVRREVGRLVHIPIWDSLTTQRLKIELKKYPQIKKAWAQFQAQKADAEEAAVQDVVLDEFPLCMEECKFFPSLVEKFVQVCRGTSEDGPVAADTLMYCARFLELVLGLLSQLRTRRFTHTLLENTQLVLVCMHSPLYKNPNAQLFKQLVDMLKSSMQFEINNQTGRPLTANDVTQERYARIEALQREAYQSSGIFKEIAFMSPSSMTSTFLKGVYDGLSDEDIEQLCERLGLLPPKWVYITSEVGESTIRRDFLIDILVCDVEAIPSPIEVANDSSLYPDEQLLWDTKQIPPGSYYGNQVLALPKLNLQFLTFQDYLWRNFCLFRLESAYEIRQDLIDVIKRIQPRRGVRGDTLFDGWARMGIPISKLEIEEVAKPLIGQRMPAFVKACVEIDLGKFSGSIRSEWEALREHDVLFLVCAKGPLSTEAAALEQKDADTHINGKRGRDGETQSRRADDDDEDFPIRYGISYVRGCEVFEMRDSDNVVLNDPTRPDERPTGRYGNIRRLRVYLDPSQYFHDMKNGRDVYEVVNLCVRRNPKENNFKGVLQTIRSVMNSHSVGRAVPDWLHDVILGYGNPMRAHYSNLAQEDQIEMDFLDTFLDSTHLRESFPGKVITFSSDSVCVCGALARAHTACVDPPPPYKIAFKKGAGKDPEELFVRHYCQKKVGPFPEDAPPVNRVRYTPVQVEAIRSGMHRGLTMVVGPPGTGKTDTCVQIISNLYNNYPAEKVLVVTHSNAALNDVFEKIAHHNVDQRHLLRLGTGERELREELQVDFSKWGRVNYSLGRRLQLLEELGRLGTSLGVRGDVAATCETAEYFFVGHLQPRIEVFDGVLGTLFDKLRSMNKTGKEENKGEADIGEAELASILEGDDLAHFTSEVINTFPFTTFFETSPAWGGVRRNLFVEGAGFLPAVETARACVRYLMKMFDEIKDFRAFELLRTQKHRGDYLLAKQARVVAMTCTHAAIARERLVEVGFKYDSIVMEESAQVLEVETFIPMLLQNVDKVEGARLKRVILIGDHHQLPPVVQHQAFQSYSNLGQSLFTRFIRLGVPNITLDAQGRCRPSLLKLFNWRYGNAIRDLPHIYNVGPFAYANAGFACLYQCVDVGDWEGRGETCPTPHFLQNLGEAEYICAVYQYMRLIGYPSSSIAVLTSYNGQKQLLNDVIRERCKGVYAGGFSFGMPSAIDTVDRFQGRQCDMILLSLVRTSSVGHIRDVRRLVVAMSRARLGLYVFCRKSLFENCFELAPVFNKLAHAPPLFDPLAHAHPKPPQDPHTLRLVLGEHFPSSRPWDMCVCAEEQSLYSVKDATAMGVLVYRMTQQLQAMHTIVADYVQTTKEVQPQAPDDPSRSTPMDMEPNPNPNSNPSETEEAQERKD